MTEFDAIARYFSNLVPNKNNIALGIGDDAALYNISEDMQLAVTIDTLVAGVHFPETTSPENIAYKALAVNLSDLGAMGATPTWMTLALTCPQIDEMWLSKFSQGLTELAEIAKINLIGGDTTQGPLTITIQAAGLVPFGQALHRQGAQPGDCIYVTGTLGDAGLGLASILGHIELPTPFRLYSEARLNRPTPRWLEGQDLRSVATSAIDISDGLVADLGHILSMSHVGATIQLERLPLSEAVQQTLSPTDAWELALTAGDDYELCFTVPPNRKKLLSDVLKTSRCTQIGTIESTLGLRCLTADGTRFIPKGKGYQHFR